MIQNGFDRPMGGEQFSTIHGDLITETTIKTEVKERGGQPRSGHRAPEHIETSLRKSKETNKED